MILKKNNIVLLGMTGVGKTTIGKILSKTTMCDFIDIDYEIEKASNMKVSNFFIQYNEKEFRKIEKKILIRNLLNENNTIISTGAGVLSDEEIIKFVKNESTSIFLDINLSILIKAQSYEKVVVYKLYHISIMLGRANGFAIRPCI